MSSELQSHAAFEATLFGFFVRQFTKPKPIRADTKLTGQTAIVTGANTGIGLASCRQFLGFGLSHLIMGVRSQAKGDEAANQLRKEFPAADISVWIIDMQSYDSIQAFVEQCKSLPRIDMTVLNAALMKSTYTTVPSTDHEISVQVNYLSTALLSILLLPVLRSKKVPGAARPPVLSIVGSDLAYRVDIQTKGPTMQQFDTPEGYDQFLWYGRSKLLLTFFAAKLAEHVDPDEVLVNMVNPGTTKGTSFFREFSTLSGMMVGVLQFLFARGVDVGATTYLDAAVARGKGSHGSFVSDWTLKPYPLVWYTEEGREFDEKLWEETMEELNFAGASKIVADMTRR
ncbi:NAD(P)-binding protein [Sodiomyces alkalinus F11]|uniref:NAD(P)-binding protein n=1 Tax=Sodiomyces alkalinus (strain CBS 110278 / VKM F-3762 / F11) TaxID=1314773 RepID=A0A3N2PX30_SODAK|nr:NAD(P)-binding protein [Sodiomyces alkalinus F11]ROT38905.1 NAD(P)-binding protein [Sodiomyces alkalinus F11]